MRDSDLIRAEIVAGAIKNVPQEFESAVKLSTLKEWPTATNPKRHDVDGIAESVQINGAYGVLLVQKSTRRILAGNGRKQAFKKLKISHRDVVWLDVDDATAERIVGVDNRLQQTGGYDDKALYAYLHKQQARDNLRGTGYVDADVEAARRVLEREKDPGTTRVRVSATSSFQLVVTCTNEADWAKLAVELKGRGYKCRRANPDKSGAGT